MLNFNSCVICNDSISDPVCRSCYLKQTKILLNDLNLKPVVNKIILTKINSRFPKDILNETLCILCGENNITLCHYCFTVILSTLLKELNFSAEIIEGLSIQSNQN